MIISKITSRREKLQNIKTFKYSCFSVASMVKYAESIKVNEKNDSKIRLEN